MLMCYEQRRPLALQKRQVKPIKGAKAFAVLGRMLLAKSHILDFKSLLKGTWSHTGKAHRGSAGVGHVAETLASRASFC